MKKTHGDSFQYENQDILALNDNLNNSGEKIYSNTNLNKIIYRVHKQIYQNKKVDPKDTILVVGSPRSGTTILEEILCSLHNYTYLFEPLNPRQYPESIKAGFAARSSYMPSNENSNNFKRYLDEVFSGKVYDRYPAVQLQFELLAKRLICTKLVVKSVRMSRLVPWIEKKFDLHHIFLTIRHPCSVVASQLRTTFTGYHHTKFPFKRYFPNKEQILQEASKINNFDTDIYKKLKLIEKPEEILSAAWCLDLYVPLKENNSSRTDVFYENLISNKETELRRIFKKLDEEPSRLAFKLANKPSITTHQNNPKNVTDTQSQLTKWKDILSEKQVERILHVAHNFGFDFYSTKLLPNVENIKY